MPPEDRPQPAPGRGGSADRGDQGELDQTIARSAGRRAGDDPPAQPRRVQQHDPRPGRRRLPAGRRFPLRRRRLRLRQHRRRADAAADPDGEVPGRRRDDRREGDRGRPRRRPGQGELPESHRRIIFRDADSRRDRTSAPARSSSGSPAGPTAGRSTPGEVGRLHPVRRPGAGGRRELRARHPARRRGGPGLAAVPLPRRARPRPRVARPAPSAADASGQRLRAGLAAVVFPLEQHARRRAVRAWPARASCRDRAIPRAARSGGCSRDPKARALVENFAGQWLQLRNLETINPDREQFPGFDERSAQAMLRETRAVLRVGRCARTGACSTSSTPTTPSSTSGWPGTTASGRQGRRVPPGPARRRPQRGGLLDAGEHPDRDLEPDPDLAGEAGQVDPRADPRHAAAAAAARRARAEGGARTSSAGTLRQRMEQHRANPSCAACHARMDPLGFGLENYDAIGAWREQDGGIPIDASGTLPDGRVVQGAGRARRRS